MPKQPNVLWIQTDEQRADSLSCYGSRWAKTPALESLARRGCVMLDAVCQSPVCVPSRASQLAARYPQELACLNNHGQRRPFPAGTVTFPEIFRQAGYETVSFGKRHTPIHEIWEGGAEKHIFPEHAGSFGLNERYDEREHHVIKRAGERGLVLAGTYPSVETNPSKHITDQAIDYLKRRGPSDRPFLLRVSHLWPHTPVLAPSPFDRLYSPDELPIRFFDEAVYRGRPKFDRDVANLHMMWELSEEQVRQVWKDYMGLCAYVDSETGRLLDTLDALGLTEETIVVYSADHGKMLGEWGAGEKDIFDNRAWRVPFIWSWPGHIPEGESREELCELIDTGRTLLTLTGLAGRIPPEYRGRNLFGGPPPEATFGVIRKHETPLDSDEMRVGIRTGRHRMDVSWPIGGARPSREYLDGGLYDLHSDPFETRNLWDSPSHAGLAEDLLSRIERHLAEAPPHPFLTDPETATGFL